MKMLLALMILTGVAGQPASASDDHNHEASVEAAPHGGVLRDAAPYKVELVLNGDKATVYVYDSKLKPVKLSKETATGHLGFPKDKTPKQIVFKRAGDTYEATLAGVSKVHRYDLHINIEAAGKKVMADFGVDNIH